MTGRQADAPAADVGADPITLGELADKDVSVLKGVGPKKLEGLRALGIGDLHALLTHYPRRYVDRTREARISDLRVGEEALVIGRVASVSAQRTRNRRVMVHAEVRDATGSMRVTFFNQPWRERQLSAISGEVAFFGKVESFRGRRQMTNPVVDLVGDRTGRIVAIYPLSEKSGLSTWEIGEWVDQTLRRSARRGLADPVPSWVLERWDLPSRGAALRGIHQPESMAHMADARRRLVFDELLRLQLTLVQRKRELERSSKGIVQATGEEEGAAPGLVRRFLEGLSYELTGAQQRAVREIFEDLASPVPMHRLLQGDVGAGKTVVAVATLLAAVQGGHQGALMAPTEVLAEQHAASVRALLDGLTVAEPGSLLGERPLAVALLTGRTRAAERRRILAGLADGTVDIVIGTHALIQDAVEFRSLGAVVVDEQHRFGVEQRAALRATNADGTVPDVLVMTATPIPRTAAMTVYGDLDVTVLDELPPGRTPISTTWARDEAAVHAAWELVRAEVAAGRRAYVVCPLVEDSDKMEAASAEQTYAELADGELAGLDLGLLHGRVPAEDKQQVMEDFRAGRIDVLVATTVIEVGVDVPEATVMVILDADRFGIAQLHQLRGRVGRGADASHCVLVTGEEVSAEAEERLRAMVRTTDGFELAEVDLDLRGEGTVMGERQKGRNDLKLASLRRDREWVERAREVAVELVGDGTGLEAHPLLVEELDLVLDEEDREFLAKS
ncbi:MAG TPA: ATP-dependent DNA helicase RecG [Microthrixaceae bacterium]|nr:ATP-dependent DNA helicase RecG [Microthrixaceae bacterium]